MVLKKINFNQGNYDKFIIGEIVEKDDHYEVTEKNGKKHTVFKRYVTSIMEM